MNTGDDRSEEADLLDQILSGGKAPEVSKSSRVVDDLVRDALHGNRLARPDVAALIERAIQSVEKDIEKQLLAVIRHPDFQAFEGRWRGLFELIRRTEIDSVQTIRILDVTLDEIAEDLSSQRSIEQSILGRKLAPRSDDEDDQPPFTMLLVDQDLSKRADTIAMVQRVSALGLMARALVIAPGPVNLCGCSRWSQLREEEISLGAGLNSEDREAWKNFRESEEARAILLTAPPVLARRPHGPDSALVEEFPFDELAEENGGSWPRIVDHLPWMSAVYVVGSMIAERFLDESVDEDDELSDIGARLTGLNSFIMPDDDGDAVVVGPMEVSLDRHQMAELFGLGFSPIQQSREGDHIVMSRFQTPFLASED